jgi:hypothetical protein
MRILNLGTRWGWVVSFTPRCFSVSKISDCYFAFPSQVRNWNSNRMFRGDEGIRRHSLRISASLSRDHYRRSCKQPLCFWGFNLGAATAANNIKHLNNNNNNSNNNNNNFALSALFNKMKETVQEEDTLQATKHLSQHFCNTNAIKQTMLLVMVTQLPGMLWYTDGTPLQIMWVNLFVCQQDLQSPFVSFVVPAVCGLFSRGVFI